MILLGMENTDQRETRFCAGSKPEERAEPAYETQVLLSKIKLLSLHRLYLNNYLPDF
jgi:hypothetical protein